jgi:hypothetical protein
MVQVVNSSMAFPFVKDADASRKLVPPLPAAHLQADYTTPGRARPVRAGRLGRSTVETRSSLPSSQRDSEAPIVSELDLNEFKPRQLLSQPATALSEVILQTPLVPLGADRYVGVLMLFIDEEGIVQHVEIEEKTLPPVLEFAAIDAFTAAHFLPGRVDGNPVKSRQRVEVVFDNTPLVYR